MVLRLGLQEDVRLVPFQASVDSVYRALDVVCSPSRGPEIGRPVLEGQAHGRPVVATGSATGGGLIRDGETGFLIPQRDPLALAASLHRLIRDGSLRRRVGLEAYAHAEANYALPRAAHRMMEVYSRALGN